MADRARRDPAMGVTLVADGGASSLRMGVVADPADPGSGLERTVRVPGFQWTRRGDAVGQQIDRLVAAWHELGSPSPIDALAFGLTGGGANDPDGRRKLAEHAAERLGAGRAYATSDAVTTHLGALGGDPGVVVAAGTGTLCLAVTPDGRLRNVDGLGYLFGDLGSGFAIGLAGIRAALAAAEGRGPSTALLPALVQRVGEPVRERVKTLYASDTLIADVASFAEVVADAAGADEVATRLCRAAGADLATVVAAALRLAFPDAGPASVPVSWSGSVLRASRIVFDAFAAALLAQNPSALPAEPRGDSLSGAIRLATGAQVPHLSAVARYPA